MPCGEIPETSTWEVSSPRGADFILVLLDQSLGLGEPLRREPVVDGQLEPGVEPELGFTGRVATWMWSRRSSREKKKKRYPPSRRRSDSWRDSTRASRDWRAPGALASKCPPGLPMTAPASWPAAPGAAPWRRQLPSAPRRSWPHTRMPARSSALREAMLPTSQRAAGTWRPSCAMRLSSWSR